MPPEVPATWRLYGCVDHAVDPLLDSEAYDPDSATTVPPEAVGTTTSDPLWKRAAAWDQHDGRIDCPSDGLRYAPALIAATQSLDTRRTLGTRDQITQLALSYDAHTWYPAPGRGTPDAPAIADPTDSARGLYDDDHDGRFDPRYARAPETDAQGRPVPVDSTNDGWPDILPWYADTDSSSDNYHPSLTFTQTTTWTNPDGRTDPLVAGDGLLLPTTPSPDGLIFGGRPSNAPIGTSWLPNPFGLGPLPGRDPATETPIALLTPPITVRARDVLGFLDHAITVDAIASAGPGSPAEMRLDVQSRSNLVPEPIADDVHLRAPVPAAAPEGQVDLTRPWTSYHASILFANRTGVGAGPDQPGPDDLALTTLRDGSRTNEADSRSWFLVLDAISVDPETGTPVAHVRAGRILATTAPWNLLHAAGEQHVVQTIRIDDGHLAGYTMRRIIPLGTTYVHPSPAIAVQGVRPEATIEAPWPYGATHTTVRSIGLPLERDASGFLRGEDPNDRALDSDDLLWQPGRERLRDRTLISDPVTIMPRGTGAIQGLKEHAPGAPAHWLDIESDAAIVLDSHTLATALPNARPGKPVTIALDPVVAANLSDKVDGSNPTDPTAALRPGPDTVRLWGRPIGPAHVATGTSLHLAPVRIAGDTTAETIADNAAPRDQAVGLEISYAPLQPLAGTSPIVEPHLVGTSADPDDGTPRGPFVAQDADHDHAADRAVSALDPQTGEHHTVPMLRVTYDHQLLEPGATQSALIQPGPETRLLIPHTDRDDGRPGLDSYDLDADGRVDPVTVRGHWRTIADADPSKALGHGGPIDETDLVWLQSPIVTAGTGAVLQFFDKGVTVLRIEPSSGIEMNLNDHGGRGNPRPTSMLTGVDPETTGCAAIRNDGSSDTRPRACDTIRASHNGQVHATDHRWWVEVIGYDTTTVQLRFNLVYTWHDRIPDDDQTRFVAGGVLYQWGDPGLEVGSSRSRLAMISLTEHRPLGLAPIHRTGDLAAVLTSQDLGQAVALAPPWGRTAVPVDPPGAAARATPMIVPLRADPAWAPLIEQPITIGRPDEALPFRVHRVHADPLVGAPGAYRPSQQPPRLVTTGPDAITGALAGTSGLARSTSLVLALDSGHLTTLQVPGLGAWRVDSETLDPHAVTGSERVTDSSAPDSDTPETIPPVEAGAGADSGDEIQGNGSDGGPRRTPGPASGVIVLVVGLLLVLPRRQR